MAKIYKATHARESMSKVMHTKMNMEAGPTRLVSPELFLLVDTDEMQKQVNALENKVARMERIEAKRRWVHAR